MSHSFFFPLAGKQADCLEIILCFGTVAHELKRDSGSSAYVEKLAGNL